jgi:hypothetical protein
MIALFRTGSMYKLTVAKPLASTIDQAVARLNQTTNKKNTMSAERFHLSPYMEAMWNIYREGLAIEQDKEHGKPIFVRNRVDNRVFMQQYQANFPVEDFIGCEQLYET